MDILRLGPNRPAHFYRGGPWIASFRGLDDPVDTRPEDWIASVTTRAGDDSVGLTVLPDREQALERRREAERDLRGSADARAEEPARLASVRRPQRPAVAPVDGHRLDVRHKWLQ